MAVITYKCPNCGGELKFDPADQNYHCEYCSSDFDQSQMEQMTPESQQEQREGENGVVLYNCPSCGAEIVTDETTTATFCYYCHNPVVLAGKMQGDFQPDFVLPFAIDREKALEIFRQWIGKKRFVPKAFYAADQIEKLTGVYFPYWLYNCQVDGTLEAQATKVKSWMTGSTQFTQTEQYEVRREGQMQVEHVTRNALKKANRELIEGVLPFEMEQLKPFSMGYLSGFQAENRDMQQTDFAREVEQEVQEYAVNNLRSQVSGYDTLSIQNQTAAIVKPEWNYALMPVWTLTYKAGEKIYYFACNGQTGKICGELPVDKGMLAGLFASVFVPLLAVLMIVGYFL